MQVVMESTPIFEIPVPVIDQRAHSAATTAYRKRKRGDQYEKVGTDSGTHDRTEPSLDLAIPAEYTAVVTPSERAQRRLAGLPLDQEPPSYPFPHAGPSLNNDKRNTESSNPTKGGQPGAVQLSKPSLHAQHLTAMIAVLHRCMMAQDYDRAARALGLLLRNQLNGQPIDIRNGGLWGIGAEILLRQKLGQDRQSHSNDGSNTDVISRAGFERARLYYERLIIQYPQHKTWVDTTNALDFTIALFTLWVYVVNHETLQAQERFAAEISSGTSLEGPELTAQEARDWELEQATQIAAAMDIRMRDVLFGNNSAMVRLRAMVALWIADLIEQHSDTTNEQDSQLLHDHVDTIGLSSRIEGTAINRQYGLRPQSGFSEAERNRNLATSLFQRL